jgi:hypothetical protein
MKQTKIIKILCTEPDVPIVLHPDTGLTEFVEKFQEYVPFGLFARP